MNSLTGNPDTSYPANASLAPVRGLPDPSPRTIRGGDSQDGIRELLREAGAAERRGCDVVGMEEP